MPGMAFVSSRRASGAGAICNHDETFPLYHAGGHQDKSMDGKSIHKSSKIVAFMLSWNV